MTTTTNKSSTTPLMRQYLQIKERYPDEIVFFRLGDFYEMFFDDAIKAAPIMEVALTKRQTTPMCGVPHHSSTGYMAKLIKAGVSVAVAEQLEDPKKTKGMVKRDVVRVMTPGTLIEEALLPSTANNFLVALYLEHKPRSRQGHWSLAAADISTGDQWVGEVNDDLNWNQLKSQLASLNPSEIIYVGDESQTAAQDILTSAVTRIEPLPPQSRNKKDHVLHAIQNYLNRDHGTPGQKLKSPQALPTESAGILFLDESALRNLELVQSSDPSGSGPTLLGILDQTGTALGSRLLRWWVLHPSINKDVIQERLNQVGDLVEEVEIRNVLQQKLKEVADIERILVRTQAGTASPRDLAALRSSLHQIPELESQLKKLDVQIVASHFSNLAKQLDIPSALTAVLNKKLAQDPPFKITDGGVIADGQNQELDELRSLKRTGRKWVAEMEATERTRTNITNLKVGYNDVFGYYLEVSKSHLGKVPSEWIRKQTLTNAERFITPELKEQEEKILGAQEKIEVLESLLYSELVHEVASFSTSLIQVAQAIAHVDAVASLAQVAQEKGYVKPEINNSDELNIIDGRHPVVEAQLGSDRFIPNDIQLGSKEKRISIITGPNMAGKSTYLRQNALIAIMAQMGSFVPAKKATIGLVDRIFTRIGASDRLAQGQSTFMVEMSEVATLLHHCTSKSLLIMDEVGRGTSTYDGVSIAWAVIDFLARSQSPRTLFATHYFELTQLAESLPGVQNAHATAKEWTGPQGRRQVVFLYQIKPGPADRSYGIHVAEMADIPDECIKRAREILKQLESGNHQLSKSSNKKFENDQLNLFGGHPIVEEIKEMAVEQMTPLEALNKLNELKKKLDT